MCNLSEGLTEQVTKKVTKETENRIFDVYALLNKKASLQEISERMKMSVEEVARIAKRFQDSTVKA